MYRSFTLLRMTCPVVAILSKAKDLYAWMKNNIKLCVI